MFQKSIKSISKLIKQTYGGNNMLLERIVATLKEYTGKTELAITEDTSFEDLEMDSLDIVELAMKIEDEFNVNIEMSENIKTVGDLLHIIEKAS
jgi:acyl carrier protein